MCIRWGATMVPGKTRSEEKKIKNTITITITITVKYNLASYLINV